MRRFAVALTALTVAASPALAQNGCPAGALTPTRDLQCNAADLFAYMAPQLGTAVAGGSHTLGLGTTVGGLPHFAVALRMNVVAGTTPDLEPLGAVNSTPGTNLGTNGAALAFPTVDASVGLFKGIGLGVTRIGGVDLLASATYVPEVETDGISIAPADGSLKIGYGVRVGLLQQSLIVPGVTFSYLKRDLPTVSLQAGTSGATFDMQDFSLTTSSWRLSAQKNLLMLQVAAGYGQDSYDASANIGVSATGLTIPNVNASVATKRTTMYGSLGLNLVIARIVAEVGQVSGGDVATYNTFSTGPNAKRLYGSIGIRAGF
jgi:hypothetical protein